MCICACVFLWMCVICTYGIFLVSVLLIHPCGTECAGLGAGLGDPLCWAAFLCRPMAVCWGGMQRCCALHLEVFSGLANTGKFTGIIIPV